MKYYICYCVLCLFIHLHCFIWCVKGLSEMTCCAHFALVITLVLCVSFVHQIKYFWQSNFLKPIFQSPHQVIEKYRLPKWSTKKI